MKIAPELHGTCDERFSAVRDAFAAIVSECDALIGNDSTCASRVTEIPYIYLDEVTGGASCDHYDHSRTAGQGTSSITLGIVVGETILATNIFRHIGAARGRARSRGSRLPA